MNQLRLLICVVLIALITACASPTASPIPPTATLIPPTATPVPPTATAPPIPPTATAVPTATPTKPPSPTPIPVLPPEPRAIKFKAADGFDLDGLYYPAAVNPAPIIVLMHWVGADQSD